MGVRRPSPTGTGVICGTYVDAGGACGCRRPRCCHCCHCCPRPLWPGAAHLPLGSTWQHRMGPPRPVALPWRPPRHTRPPQELGLGLLQPRRAPISRPGQSRWHPQRHQGAGFCSVHHAMCVVPSPRGPAVLIPHPLHLQPSQLQPAPASSKPHPQPRPGIHTCTSLTHSSCTGWDAGDGVHGTHKH